LGDNHQKAYDGRCWELVKKEEIIGKANKIFYPFNRAGEIPSPDFPGLPKPQR
jgi:signal peptidase I